MERLSAGSDDNSTSYLISNLIILSYHRFGSEESDYPFSRTYKQFRNDLETKDFDFICFDDNTKCQIKAAKMMKDLNFRAKIFTSTSLVGEDGYCTWADLWKLSKFHDIENHGNNHVNLTELPEEAVYTNIDIANELIKQETGRKPRYFVPPWNAYNETVEAVAKDLGLILLKDRINIKNDSR